MSERRKLSRRNFIPAGVAATMGLGQAQTAAKAPSSKYPVLDTADVLVVGGGPAGVGAAIGAARAGAKTLLVENHSFFGGVAAFGLGMQMNQMRPEGKARSSVHELVIGKLAAYGDQAVRFGEHEVWSNVEYLKVAILDALDEARAGYLVHMRAVDSVMEGDRVTGVVVATKRGLMVVRAKCVVDCSGDADIAFFGGAETITDPKTLMPQTLALALTNLGSAQVSDVTAALRAGKKKYPLITSGFLEIKQIANSHAIWVNHAGTADMGRIDVTDPRERSRAECTSRRQAVQMIQAIRESENPSVRQIELATAGPQISIRETRRIKGLYQITEEDALKGRTFEDTVAWRSGYVDLGGQAGVPMTTMKVHDVPYRSLLPEKIDGLLVGGRCISATHVAAAAGKSMGNCMATGHAAGVAAAMCAQKGILPRELKVPELQAKLRSDGVKLELPDRDQKTLPALS